MSTFGNQWFEYPKRAFQHHMMVSIIPLTEIKAFLHTEIRNYDHCTRTQLSATASTAEMESHAFLGMQSTLIMLVLELFYYK